jgi:tetratricopeptide (TPR) repeat protein
MEQDTLYRTLKEIANGHVYVAICNMRDYASNHSIGMWRDELESLISDYELMMDYLGRGIIDPDREKIHMRISTRLERCVRNIMLYNKTLASPFYQEAKRKGGDIPLEIDQLKAELEGFVSEQAMLGLLSDEELTAKTTEIYARHVGQMSAFFHRIIVSPQWNESMRGQMTELLTSPTIDSFDAQLMVSAITISTLNHTDEQKMLTLAGVYRDATDMKIRQRALVGWVFASAMGDKTHDEITSLCDDESVAREVADMQKQVMFCLNADKDNQTIQKDIIPELMKNQNLNITRFGITEKEDDPMEDILNPNADDERMEKLESTMNRMEKMQKEGSDIYFGGFSQMKRFTFFNDMANWFWPFFIEHPGVQDALSKMGEAGFLKNMLNYGPFCESDKYSFLLTMKTVIERLPANVREMMQSGYEMGPVVSDADRNSGAYIRRMYLQDIYRFYRLNFHKNELRSPFTDERFFLFVTNKTFSGTKVSRKLPELAWFMHKRQMANCFSAIAERIIRSTKDEQDMDYVHIASLYFFEYKKDAGAAYSVLKRAWDEGLLNDDVAGLKMLGRVSLVKKDYEMACDCYKRLQEMNPDNSNYALNYCVTLMKLARYHEACDILYRLDYEHPSANTTRALAWALMGEGKKEQADALYQKLLLQENTAPEDFLNAAYCQWFMGNVRNAVQYFSDYKDSLGKKQLPSDWLSKEFENDMQMLEANGIRSVDMMLMADIVEKNTKGTDSADGQTIL